MAPTIGLADSLKDGALLPPPVCRQENAVISGVIKYLSTQMNGTILFSDAPPIQPFELARGVDGHVQLDANGRSITRPISADSAFWTGSDGQDKLGAEIIRSWVAAGDTSAAACWKRTKSSNFRVVSDIDAQKVTGNPHRTDSVVRIGRPVYDHSGSVAMVLLNYTCPGLCGAQEFVILRKRHSYWVKTGIRLISMS